MAIMIDGQWRDQWYETDSTGGRFIRDKSVFRDNVGDLQFPVAARCYHLYVSNACPWSNRTTIFRKLKGIEEIISLGEVMPVVTSGGWEFYSGGDPQTGANNLYQVYALAMPDYTGRVKTPMLWDRQTKTIVNNESSEII